MIHPLPPISKVVSLAIQHERQTDIGGSEDSKAIVYAATEGKKPYGRGNFDSSSYMNTGKFCTHCKKPGHKIDICYRLHGYPTSFNSKYSSNSTSHANNTSRSYDSNDDQEEDTFSQKENVELFTADQ